MVDRPADAAKFECIGGAYWDIIAQAALEVPPGGDVPGRKRREPGGVAANIARALAGFGADVSLVAVVSDDADGEGLLALIQASGANVSRILRTPPPSDTFVALETPDGELLAGVADCTGLESNADALVADLLSSTEDAVRTWVVDGNLPDAALARLAEAQRQRTQPLAIVAASPAKASRLARFLPVASATLYCNRAEAEALADQSLPDAATAAAALRSRDGWSVLVTDGAHPAAWADGDGLLTLSPAAITLRRATGAGDRLVAAHLLARAQGRPPQEALRAAIAAAAAHASGETP